ncbi:ubiquinol-cytochrome C chaperone family protein [Sphingomonas sp. EC-HK361]|uniref:ubiquinol-cytochrome C chaperone family protein n=1 Tax=Sphingomonas sp. EC-HK361 TaxID=2038397 RepID=UPI003FA3A719
MGLFDRLFGDRTSEAQLLYNAAVAKGREPHWYVEGAVPDTVDGRFDMITAIVAVIMLRLEDDPDGAAPNARLAECFVADMDGQMRELGIGDVVVGKKIGRLMSLLGGRLGAYRDGLAGGSLDEALVRNLYRGVAPGNEAVVHVAKRLAALRADLDQVTIPALLEGRLP